MKFAKILMISAAFAAAAFARSPLKPCSVGGCSGEICSEEEGMASICIWEPSFTCYQDAICERQANGECGWTQTEAFEKCLENAGNDDVFLDKPCHVGGCSGEICSEEEGMASICLWSPEFACYKDAVCERQADGQCGWTQTESFEKCLGTAGNEDVLLEKPCHVGGCSSEICSEEEGLASICMWSPAFACFQDAVCERQAGGECGWTQTEALQACLDNTTNDDTLERVY